MSIIYKSEEIWMVDEWKRMLQQLRDRITKK